MKTITPLAWTVLCFTALLAGAATSQIQRVSPGATLRPFGQLPDFAIAHTGMIRNDRLLLPILKEGTNLDVAHRVGANVVPMAGGLINISGRPHAVAASDRWTVLRSSEPARPRSLSTNQILGRDLGVIATSPGKAAHARLLMKIDDVPMPWKPNYLKYRTTIRVGFAPTNVDPSANLPAVSVHLRATDVNLENDADHILTVQTPGLGGARAVPVFATDYSTNASITASTDIGEETFLIQIRPLGFLGMFTQIFPGPVLVLIGIGAGLGGALRAFKREQKWYWCILEGIIAGALLVAVVAGLGIKLPIGQIPAQALTHPLGLFALAGIGGYGGATLFEKMIAKLRPT